MKRKLFFTGLLVLCVLLTAGCSSKSTDNNPLKLESANRFELMIGLNDATTGKQILDTQQATDTIKKKILDHVSGVTMTVSNGAYYVGALVVDETTLNCVIYGADDDAIAKIVDEINSELNLTVLVAKSASDYRLIAPNQFSEEQK